MAMYLGRETEGWMDIWVANGWMEIILCKHDFLLQIISQNGCTMVYLTFFILEHFV